MKNPVSGELPLGFGMALAHDPAAMQAFCQMDDEKRLQLLEEARQAQSKAEMQRVVHRLTGQA